MLQSVSLSLLLVPVSARQCIQTTRCHHPRLDDQTALLAAEVSPSSVQLPDDGSDQLLFPRGDQRICSVPVGLGLHLSHLRKRRHHLHARCDVVPMEVDLPTGTDPLRRDDSQPQSADFRRGGGNRHHRQATAAEAASIPQQVRCDQQRGRQRLLLEPLLDLREARLRGEQCAVPRSTGQTAQKSPALAVRPTAHTTSA